MEDVGFIKNRKYYKRRKVLGKHTGLRRDIAGKKTVGRNN